MAQEVGEVKQSPQDEELCSSSLWPLDSDASGSRRVAVAAGFNLILRFMIKKIGARQTDNQKLTKMTAHAPPPPHSTTRSLTPEGIVVFVP